MDEDVKQEVKNYLERELRSARREYDNAVRQAELVKANRTRAEKRIVTLNKALKDVETS